MKQFFKGIFKEIELFFKVHSKLAEFLGICISLFVGIYIMKFGFFFAYTIFLAKGFTLDDLLVVFLILFSWEIWKFGFRFIETFPTDKEEEDFDFQYMLDRFNVNYKKDE